MSEYGQYDSRINEILHEQGESIRDAKRLLEEIFNKSQQTISSSSFDIKPYNKRIEEHIEGIELEITGRDMLIIDDYGIISPATLESYDLDRYGDGFYPCIKEATIDGISFEKYFLSEEKLMYHGTFWHDQANDIMQFIVPVESSHVKICDEEGIEYYYTTKERIGQIEDPKTQDQVYDLYDSLSRLREFGKKTLDSVQFAESRLKQINFDKLTDDQKYMIEDILHSTIFQDDKIPFDIKAKSLEEIAANSYRWRIQKLSKNKTFPLYGLPAAVIIENSTPYLFIREYFEDEGEIHDNNIIRVPLKDILELREDG